MDETTPPLKDEVTVARAEKNFSQSIEMPQIRISPVAATSDSVTSDDQLSRKTAKNAFDNQAFDIVSEIPDSIWKKNKGVTTPVEDGTVKTSWLDSFCEKAQTVFSRHKRKFKSVLKFLLFVLYNVYLLFAIHRTWETTDSYCEGVKFLVVLTAIVYFLVFYYILLVPFILNPLKKKCVPFLERFQKLFHKRYMNWLAWFVVFLAICIFLIIDTQGDRYRLVSAGGLIVLVLLGYIFSAHRRKVIWNQVLRGITLQFVFGIIILRWDVGKEILACVASKVSNFLEYTNHGSEFLFGYLATGKLEGGLPQQFAVFAFKVLPVILFFSFITSILYYYGIMQKMVMKVGWLLNKTMSTTACESMNAAGNILLGMTEAPLLIKPYLPIMTKSEIHAVMTGGFATVAGSVMAAYISFGISPSHLLSASLMSAPAALAYSKLLYPETESSQTHIEDIKIEKGKEQNALEAAVNGASAAISLVANVAANLIVFLAFIYFLDSVVTWFGTVIGWDFISFEWILSKLFVPISFLMGVEWRDCESVARLVGLKTVVNEFVAYKGLSELIQKGQLTERSRAIATYALCGFSNIGSIGIQLGALGTMAPERKPDLAKLSVRAMIAGSAACFMTASIAGTLLHQT